MQKTKTARPAPPDELDGEALLEWQRVCDELASIDRLEKTDRAILTLYVETWAVHRAATRGVSKHGAVIKHSNGAVGTSPFYKTQKESGLQLRGLLNDLGLTPAARGNAQAGAADAGDLEI